MRLHDIMRLLHEATLCPTHRFGQQLAVCY